MKFAELVHSSGWKNFMAKMYGIGASIVIMGALFKIQHWTGAGIMLTVGLSVEAMIFFFSAFEPLHEELDWTLVYPELAGMQEDTDMPSLRQNSRSQQLPAQTYSGGGGNSAALAKFDQMIQNAEITPELFERLGQGLKNLHLTTSKLTDISDASLATNEYVSNLRNAALSVNSLNESFENSSRNLKGNVDVLSESYRKNSELLDTSSSKLSSSYNSLNESVDSNRASIGENLGNLNKNLSALNAVYELQLQNNNDHLKGSQVIYSDLNKMTGNLKSSVQETERYREEISKLNQNLSELNSIYGNMLSAMNVVSRKR
jgi:gliding motility-associated protein GldL